MPDNIDINTSTTATTIPVATLDVGGIQHEKVIVEHLVGGLPVMTSAADPLPVTDAAAITQLAAILAKIIAAPATAAKQDEQTALLTTLNSLIETNNYLVQFLSQLTGAMNSGAPALRTTPIASVSTAVTGTLTAVTTVGTITNFGTAIPAKEMADDINNFTVTLANINNVTA